DDLYTFVVNVSAQLAPLTGELVLRPLPEKDIFLVLVGELLYRLFVAEFERVFPLIPRSAAAGILDRTEESVIGVFALFYIFGKSRVGAVETRKRLAQNAVPSKIQLLVIYARGRIRFALF